MKKHTFSVAAASITVIAAILGLFVNNSWFIKSWGAWLEPWSWALSTLPGVAVSFLGWMKAKAAQAEAKKATEATEKAAAKAEERERIASAPIQLILISELEDLEEGDDNGDGVIDPQEVVIVKKAVEVTLPYSPARREATRAEIMGSVGMFYGAGRFSLPGLAQLFSSQGWKDMKSGVSDELRIPVSADDFVKFEAFISKM